VAMGDKAGGRLAPVKPIYMRKGPKGPSVTFRNNHSLGMEAPPTTRNLLLVKSLRRLSACRRRAASSLLVAMWCQEPLSAQAHRLHTLSLVIVAGMAKISPKADRCIQLKGPRNQFDLLI
jgi:hypothetical protein